MFEVFLHTFNGEDFFDKSFSAYSMGSFSNLPLIAPFLIDLANPPCISVTRHPHENVRVKMAESEPIQARLGLHHHDLPFGYPKYDMFGRFIANNESKW
jgi:hypothetical protein